MNFLNREVIEASQAVILIVVGLGFLALFGLTIVALVKSDNSKNEDNK